LGEYQINNIDYPRENKLAKVLKRGKINNKTEYDFVVDVIVPYLQELLINQEQAALLSKMIGDFELR